MHVGAVSLIHTLRRFDAGAVAVDTLTVSAEEIFVCATITAKSNALVVQIVSKRTPRKNMKNQINYSPPHDTEAEACALACIMEDRRGPLWVSQLDAQDWDDLRHQQIYQAMHELKALDQRVGAWQVYQRLKDTNKINGSDGLRNYVIDLPNRISSPENFPTYLATVKDRAWRREALEMLRALALLVCDTATPVAETKKKLAEAIGQLK